MAIVIPQYTLRDTLDEREEMVFDDPDDAYEQRLAWEEADEDNGIYEDYRYEIIEDYIELDDPFGETYASEEDREYWLNHYRGDLPK